MRPVVVGAVLIMGGVVGSCAESIPPTPEGSLFAELSQDEVLQQHAAAEEALRDCLAEKGFEYEPEPVSDYTLATINASPEEFVDQFGYGIAASLLASIADDDASRNAVNQAELTTEETGAMAAAMTGPDGCIAKSQRETQTGIDRSVLLLDETRQIIQEAESRIAADERTINAMTTWSSCMRERGYNFATRDDAVNQAQDALDEWMATDDTSDPNGDEYDATRRASLEALLDAERQIARDDYDCATPIQAILDDVTDEYMKPIRQQIATESGNP